MSAIEQLINVKKMANSSDIITVLNELVLYDKLSKSAAFQDIHSSVTMQKKVPFLWKALTDDLYAKALVLCAGHVITHLTGAMPEVLENSLDEIQDSQKQRLELLHKCSVAITYHSLNSYDEDTMSDKTVGIYEHKVTPDRTAIIIIVQRRNEYQIFQGFYIPSKSKTKTMQVLDAKSNAFVLKSEKNQIMIETYSIQGNNTYPFATVTTVQDTYSLMLPNHEVLWAYSHRAAKGQNPITTKPIQIWLSTMNRNELNLTKNDVKTFAKTLLDIVVNYEKIEREKYNEKIERDSC